MPIFNYLILLALLVLTLQLFISAAFSNSWSICEDILLISSSIFSLWLCSNWAKILVSKSKLTYSISYCFRFCTRFLSIKHSSSFCLLGRPLPRQSTSNSTLIGKKPAFFFCFEHLESEPWVLLCYWKF